MNEKDMFIRNCEACLKRDNLLLGHSKKVLDEGYKKLMADYDSTIMNLEFAVEEAKAQRKAKPADAKESDLISADFAIKRAKKSLELGRIKARADFETAYNSLKIDAERAAITVQNDKYWLEFAKAEKERGFSI